MRSGGMSQLKTHNPGSNIQLNTPPQSFFLYIFINSELYFPRRTSCRFRYHTGKIGCRGETAHPCDFRNGKFRIFQILQSSLNPTPAQVTGYGGTVKTRKTAAQGNPVHMKQFSNALYVQFRIGEIFINHQSGFFRASLSSRRPFCTGNSQSQNGECQRKRGKAPLPLRKRDFQLQFIKQRTGAFPRIMNSRPDSKPLKQIVSLSAVNRQPAVFKKFSGGEKVVL